MIIRTRGTYVVRRGYNPTKVCFPALFGSSQHLLVSVDQHVKTVRRAFGRTYYVCHYVRHYVWRSLWCADKLLPYVWHCEYQFTRCCISWGVSCVIVILNTCDSDLKHVSVMMCSYPKKLLNTQNIFHIFCSGKLWTWVWAMPCAMSF